MRPSIQAMLDERMKIAAACYGRIASTHEALGVAYEEWTELVQAIRTESENRIVEECIDLAAILIRLAEACDEADEAFLQRSGIME